MPDNSRKFYICHENELNDPDSKGFEIDSTGLAAFVVRRGGVISAFENRCPHTGVSLNWSADQFLDYENEYIQCSMHGALFRTSDGVCIYGPCNGESLTALPILIEAGKISVVLDR